MFDWFKQRVLRQKVRGFEPVAEWARAVPARPPTLPKRSTDGSAGYDFFSQSSAVIQPGEKVHIYTDVKVYMQRDEVFKLYPRSSHGIVYDLVLANTTGIVDSDFYSNPDNDGNMSIVIRNVGTEPFHVRTGDKIAQGVFEKYLLSDDDHKHYKKHRVGGTGSTGR